MSADNYSDQSNYGYTPSLPWAVAFIVIFSLSAALHSFQAFKSKYWVAYPTLVLGALIEVLGWSGRLWSNRNVLYVPPFLMQICTLIMAPVFFSAYDYIILGVAIRRLGPQYSILRPGWYFSVFLVADVVSLILQAIGGGQASSSAAKSAPTQSATDIMVAGIIFQLVSMVIFVSLGFDFILRATSGRAYAFRQRQIAAQAAKAAAKATAKPTEAEATLSPATSDAATLAETLAEPTTPGKEASEASAMALESVAARENLTRWWIMLAGCLVSSIAIVTRGVYRSVELSKGWESTLMQTEMYQNILDALMMVIAVGVFNVLNPLYLLPRRAKWGGFH